jgi:threonine synthase
MKKPAVSEGTFLRCHSCKHAYPLKGSGYLCPRCDGNLSVDYDFKTLKPRFSRELLGARSERGLWRYAELLPVRPDGARPIAAPGWTPLQRAERLGKELGLQRLYLKDEGRNPSASLKDRASAVVVARALDLGRRRIAGASTGNAASSLACMSAGTGISPLVFVPAAAPAAKIAQLLVFGADVVAVRGSYDDAFDLCAEACEQYGWYNRNTGFNPFTREGKKTVSFEIVEQLCWEVPDVVVVPTGDGNILSGVWKGFLDFKAVGLIDRLPRLVAVQAKGSAAIARAFESGKPIRAVKAKTIADSIAVDKPRDGDMARRALRQSRGLAVTVTDDEILDAMRKTARLEGVFAEPAAAAAVAGTAKAAREGRIRPRQSVVVLITGNGLKDVAGARRAAGKPRVIAPTMASLKALVKKNRNWNQP